MSAAVQGHTVGLFEPIYPSQHLDLQWGYFLQSEVFSKYHECLPFCWEIDGGPWELRPEKEERSAYRSKVTVPQPGGEKGTMSGTHKRKTREMRQPADRRLGNTPVHGQDLEGTGELN